MQIKKCVQYISCHKFNSEKVYATNSVIFPFIFNYLTERLIILKCIIINERILCLEGFAFRLMSKLFWYFIFLSRIKMLMLVVYFYNLNWSFSSETFLGKGDKAMLPEKCNIKNAVKRGVPSFLKNKCINRKRCYNNEWIITNNWIIEMLYLKS